MTQPKDITKPFNGKCKICNHTGTDRSEFKSLHRCKTCNKVIQREHLRKTRSRQYEEREQEIKMYFKRYYISNTKPSHSERYANDESYRNRCRVASSVRALYISETRRFRNILIN